jgi:predicted  nucleic acid-binding Zn-ribbon protein
MQDTKCNIQDARCKMQDNNPVFCILYPISCIQNPESGILLESLFFFKKTATFLISALIFITIFFSQEAQTQKISLSQNREILDSEISDLSRQLNIIETRIIPIDSELQSLQEKHERVTSEVTLLKDQLRNPKGVIDRITGILGFSERKLRNLMAESQSMSDSITELQKMREPLIKDFITIADRLIKKSEARIIALMDILLKNEPGADKTSGQISATLQLTRKVAELRDKYASESFEQVQITPFSISLGNDPEKLRLGAKISKNTAIEYRTTAEKKKRELSDLQVRQRGNERMIEKLREIQRSNEEKESGGIESGTTGITLGSNESEIRKTIITLKKNIDRLSNEIHELDDEARKLENQSKIMEQRASQIESKGK